MTDKHDKGANLTELFAHYGRAVYMANVVETAFAQTLLQVEFMTGIREEFIRTKGKNFDRQKYEDDFDTYFDKQLSRTMGELARRVGEFPDFGDELKGRINDAIKRRNFLIHDYWRETSMSIMTEDGRTEMIDELSEDSERFDKLAKDIHEATKPVRRKLGIKEEVLDERVENQMANLTCGITLD